MSPIDPVEHRATLMTDEFGACKLVAKRTGREHHSVNRGAGEYVRADVHSNTAKGFLTFEARDQDAVMPKKRTKRRYEDTTVPHVPAEELDILAALVRTPPPPVGDKSMRKQKPKQKRGRPKKA